MALWIQKFGGTSVKDLDRIQHAANIVIKAKETGHDVVVVVSAMAGETDRLIKLAQALMLDPNPREYDALVSTGEQVSAALFSLALMSKGYCARSYNAGQVK